MGKIIFESKSLDEYSDWAKEDIKIFAKIRDLFKEIQRTPFKGKGKPEPLNA